VARGIETLPVLREHGQVLLQRPLRRMPFVDGQSWNGQAAVPELIECARQILNHGPGDDDVVVAELGLRIDLEILIADIASADDRDRIVRDHQLIVHAVVQPPLVQQDLDSANDSDVSAVSERIEYANFDAGPGCQCQ
jgi:hypothetical protein